jgi:hypothetical protein
VYVVHPQVRVPLHFGGIALQAYDVDDVFGVLQCLWMVVVTRQTSPGAQDIVPQAVELPPVQAPLVHVCPELQLPQEPPHPFGPHARPVQLGTQAPAQSLTGFVTDR